MKTVIEVLGWYGVVALLGAYALLSFSFFTPDNLWYQLLNVTGAATLGVLSVHKQAYQPATVNIIWAFIGLAALFQIVF